MLAARLPGAPASAADLLYTLTGFETFDFLAGPDRELLDALPAVNRLVRAALDGGAPAPGC